MTAFHWFLLSADRVLHGILFCVLIDMAKEYAQGFYNSKAWKDCRTAYKKSVGGLCERCLAKGLYNPGVIVHHRVHINPNNVKDPQILTDFANLELLCRACHAEEHTGTQKRFVVDDLGRIHTAPNAI